MFQIRFVSDLKNKLLDIEKFVNAGAPYIWQNGYGTMVVLSLKRHFKLTNSVEVALDQSDGLANERKIYLYP